MSEEITVIAGGCSALNREDVMQRAYQLSQIQQIARPYRINMKQRECVYKPRTESQYNGVPVFEGVGPEGLPWLRDAAREFGLPIATEIMDSGDLPPFFEHLNPLRDTLWIGARDSLAYGILAFVGLTPFNVMIKNPMQGTLLNTAKGSLDRITSPTNAKYILDRYEAMCGKYPQSKIKNPNKELIYCIRGHDWYIGPDGRVDEELKEITLTKPHQHRGSRNVNNIEAIKVLRESEYFQEHRIKIFYDGNHILGGIADLKAGVSANHLRRLIGKYAITAIEEFGYDGLVIEVYDRSKHAKTDKEQALVITYNGIDYSETNMREKPSDDEKPMSLVDIVKKLMVHQVSSNNLNISAERLLVDQMALDDKIRWDMAA